MPTLPFMPWFEYLLLGVAFLVLFVAGASWVESSIAANNRTFPNDMIYMAAAIDLSRSDVGSYAHILLLKLFSLVAEPLQAAQLYWSFVVALTAVLVYVNARILSRNSSPFHSILAVYFFFATILLFKFSGVIFAEFSLMLMVTVGVTLYLLYQRLTCCRRVLLVLLGITVLFALQSKLIGGCLAFLLVGLKWVDDRPLDWPTYARHLGMVAAGMAGGLVLLFLLFGTHLSFTSAHQDLISTDLSEPASYRSTWYWFLSFRSGLMLVVSLYLVALIQQGRQQLKPGDAVVWGVPLVILLVLLATVQVQDIFWEERHFFVMLPITSILAAQVITPGQQASLQTYARYVGAAVGAFLLIWLAKESIFQIGARLGWTTENFQRGFVFPIGLTLLFALIVVARTWNLKTVFAAFLCIFLVTMQPVTHIPDTIEENNQVSRTIFYPYAEFADDITYTGDMNMYISPDIHKNYGMLSRDKEICEILFSVFFNAKSVNNEFALDRLVFLPEGAYFRYMLITTDNWNQFSPEQKQGIETIYRIKSDTQKKLVLGSAREG